MRTITAKYTTLTRIATLVSSGIHTDDVLTQSLDAIREAFNVRAVVFACLNGEDAGVRVWDSPQSCTSQSDGLPAVAKSILQGKDVEWQGVSVRADAPDGTPIAILCQDVESEDESFTEFLRAAASCLSTVINSEKLKSAVVDANYYAKKRIKEVATIYEIGQAIDRVNVDDVLVMVTEKAAAVMDAQACSLMLRDGETNCFVIEASYGLSDDIIKGARIFYGEGIAGTVAQTGEPMLLSDVSVDPRLSGSAVVPREGIASSICVPLKDEHGAVQGVLSIRRHIPSPPFTEDDLKLFCVFASQAALAISNAQLYASLSQRIQEMSTVSDLMRTINSTLDLDHVLNQIVDSIIEVVGFDRCCLYLMEPRTWELVASIRKGYDASHIEEKVRLGEGVIGMAAKERIPIFAQDTLTGDGELDTSDRPETSFLVVPIVVRDSCIGAVLVDNHLTSRPISTSNVELLSTFVSQAGIAIENARLYEAMEEKYAELNVLYEQSRAIGSAYGLQNAAELLMDVADKAVKCDAGVLLLLNERRSEISIRVSKGLDPDSFAALERASLAPTALELVSRLRSPMMISQTDADAFSSEEWDFFKVCLSDNQALLVAPLIAEDTTVGFLALIRDSEDSFQSGEIKLLSIVVSHAAGVIKNAISYEHRMRQKVLELSALYEFSKRISSASRLEDALDSILAIVSELIDNDECAIYAVEFERSVIVAKAIRSKSVPCHLPAEQPLESESITSWAIRERKALVSPDIQQDPRFEQAKPGERPVRSLMSIPLMVQDEVVGVLNVQSYRPNLYSEDDVRVLSIVASQGAAIYKELEALSALTSYTDNILSSIAAGVITLDSDGIVLSWNRAAESIVKLPGAEVVGYPFTNVIDRLDLSAEDKQRTIEAVRQVFESGETYQGYKLRFHPSYQDVMYLNMSVSQLKNSAGERLGLVLIFEDVTKEVKMEEDFRRMGELAAVGQLAASIAHELRNPLSSIKGAAQLLKEQYDEQEMIAEFLEIIIDEVNGLSRLTTEFLDFARPIQLEPRPVELNEVVGKVLQLMNVSITQAQVEVVQRFSAALPKIEADDKQLEQVLKNVILNSLQAMPGGGRLELATYEVKGPLDCVELTITDTGMGIPQDKLEKIFVPFFTTKTKGTGLGLAVVRKIVENHRGRIEVTSELDKGTTFTITLPVNAGAPLPFVAPQVEELERRVAADLRPPEI